MFTESLKYFMYGFMLKAMDLPQELFALLPPTDSIRSLFDLSQAAARVAFSFGVVCEGGMSATSLMILVTFMSGDMVKFWY